MESTQQTPKHEHQKGERKDGYHDDRTSSCYSASSSAISFSYEDALENTNAKRQGTKSPSETGTSGHSSDETGSNQPPAPQSMDRPDDVDPNRIPASVFDRNTSASVADWSMTSTDSLFGIQMAPSGDFTGFFKANPEYLNISTPPHSSTNNDANEAVLSPHFDDMPEPCMNGNYSFAFPNLIECTKHGFEKGGQEEKQTEKEQSPPPSPPAAETSPPDEAPVKAAGGSCLSWFPCCSSK